MDEKWNEIWLSFVINSTFLHQNIRTENFLFTGTIN